MEIDKAKRLYSADSTKVLSRLRHYRQNFKKKNGGNLPAFYKFIVGDESANVKNVCPPCEHSGQVK